MLEFDLVSKPVEVVLIAYGWGLGVIFEVETEGVTGVATAAPLLMTVSRLLARQDQHFASIGKHPLFSRFKYCSKPCLRSALSLFGRLPEFCQMG